MGGGVRPRLLLRPVAVHTGCADEEGRLVLADGRLVAVLVRLEDEAHAGLAGAWHLEAGFGPCAVAVPPAFSGLDAARVWVTRRLAVGRGGRSPPSPG